MKKSTAKKLSEALKRRIEETIASRKETKARILANPEMTKQVTATTTNKGNN